MSESKETTILEMMGLGHLSEEKQSEVMEKFGNLVIEGSIGQLLLTLTEEQVKQIELYVENIKEGDDVFGYLLRTYPDFQSIVEKQIAALQGEIQEIYGQQD